MKQISKIIALCVMLFVAGAFTLPAQFAPIDTHAAAKVKISKKKATIIKGKTLQLKVKGTKKKAKWSSNKKSVATVSKKGKVTAKKAGKAVITAKIGKKKYKCNITVTEPAIGLNKKSVLLCPEESYNLKLNQKGKALWSSSDATVATVSSTGRVIAKKNGVCIIFAKFKKSTLKCAVYVGTALYSDANITLSYIGRTSAGINFCLQNNTKQRMYTKINSLALDSQQFDGPEIGKEIPSKSAKSFVFKCKMDDANHKYLSLGGYCQSKDGKYLKYLNLTNKIIGDTATSPKPITNSITLINNSRVKVEYIDTTAPNLHFQITNKSSREIVLSTEKILVSLERRVIWYEDFVNKYIAPNAICSFTYQVDEHNQDIRNLSGCFDLYYPDNFDKLYHNDFSQDMHKPDQDIDGIL